MSIEAKELKRRDLSGIYIYDTFPTDKRRKPTCIEDCQQETRREWCMAHIPDYLREAIKSLADTLKEIINYLVDEGCADDELRKELFEIIDKNVERSKWNWGLHELADQVDSFCEKLVVTADLFGVTRHLKDEED